MFVLPPDPGSDPLHHRRRFRFFAQERKKLALTLQDTRTVVAKLELICGVVLHVLFAFVYLIIFQVRVRARACVCLCYRAQGKKAHRQCMRCVCVVCVRVIVLWGPGVGGWWKVLCCSGLGAGRGSRGGGGGGGLERSDAVTPERLVFGRGCRVHSLPTGRPLGHRPQVNVRELWLTFSSVTLAFVFVFGNSVGGWRVQQRR